MARCYCSCGGTTAADADERTGVTFTLPPSVDASRIAAEYQDGLLTVRLPRREESKPRQIEVK